MPFKTYKCSTGALLVFISSRTRVQQNLRTFGKFALLKTMSKGSSEKPLPVFESEWFEIKEDVREQESLKSVILNLLQKSSIYAVSQLVTSSGFGRKVLWLLVLLVGLSGCTYEIYHFLSLYFQYPVVITLEVKNNWKLDFPAVTVCNLNRYIFSSYT